MKCVVKLLVAVIASLSGMACTTVYSGPKSNGDFPEVDFLKPEYENRRLYFISNTSRVDFDDLIVIHRKNPAMEGLFDPLRPLDDASMVLNAKGSRFTPEAEWLFVFEEPLKLADGRIEMPKRVALTGMVEGKWVEELERVKPNRWQPASAGNNFIGPDKLIFRSLQEWDEILAGNGHPLTSSLDKNAKIVLKCRDSKGNGQVHTAYFRIMRKNMFAGGEKPKLSDLIRKVIEAYQKLPGSEQEAFPALAGVNMGGHGNSAGFPIGTIKPRMFRAGILALPEIVLRIGRTPFPVVVKKYVAKNIDREAMDKDYPISLEIVGVD